MTIHAYTEPGRSLPAYINLSERVANPGDVIVMVRSAGENSASSIILTRQQLLNLVADATKYLDVGHVAPGSERFPESFSFEQFVQYGRDHGANIVNGMPWSFKFHGTPVTHENDQCYLICTGTDTLRLTPNDVIVVAPNGSLSVLPAPGVGG